MSKYRYTTVINGEVQSLTHNDIDALATNVSTLLRKNNINFNAGDIHVAIKRQSNIKTIKPKSVSLASAVTGAKAILAYTTATGVGAEELLRRSAICRGCPMKTAIGGCKSCGAAGKIAKFTNKLRATLKMEEPIPKDVSRLYCEVCECSLSLMLVSKMKAFREATDKNLSRPDNCWVKTTSTNYHNE